MFGNIYHPKYSKSKMDLQRIPKVDNENCPDFLNQKNLRIFCAETAVLVNELNQNLYQKRGISMFSHSTKGFKK